MRAIPKKTQELTTDISSGDERTNINGLVDLKFKSMKVPPLLLTLLPCGGVGQKELDCLVRALSFPGMKVAVANEKEPPPGAFDAKRRQYRANFLLELARREPGDRVLAVTNCDLYSGKLNFVFGVAVPSGKSAVISFFRLRIGADEEMFRCRVLKEAVHELGHTFGLFHCMNPRCVMGFSNSLEDTDQKAMDWCDACRKKLELNPEPFPYLAYRWRFDENTVPTRGLVSPED